MWRGAATLYLFVCWAIITTSVYSRGGSANADWGIPLLWDYNWHPITLPFLLVAWICFPHYFRLYANRAFFDEVIVVTNRDQHFFILRGGASCRQPVVEVLVSPLVSPITLRSLVLSWRVESVAPGDYVALYLTDMEEQPLYTTSISMTEGWVDTGVQENRSAWESLAFSEECLGYWAAFKNTNSTRVIASSCLGTAPRWMEKQRSSIEGLSLRRLFLPGTHNSGAYLESFEPFRESTVQKYLFTQDERVLNQLIYGARVLDLRVGHYPDSLEIWWTNHAVVRVRPLSQILNDVKLFVNMTKEIVILDFHRFPVGFLQEPRNIHRSLVRYLEDSLGDYLVPKSLGWSSPLSEIWESGRRVVLSYNYQLSDSRYTWPGLTHKWGKVRSVQALHEYLTKVLKSAPLTPWSAMAEMTPNALDVLTGRLGGLRQMAARVSSNVTSWFRDSWGSDCHVVSVDFLRATGVVKAAQQWNLRRANRAVCDTW